MRSHLQLASGHRVAINLDGGDAVSGQVDHVTRSVVALVDVQVVAGGQGVPIPGQVLVPLSRIVWVQVT